MYRKIIVEIIQMFLMLLLLILIQDQQMIRERLVNTGLGPPGKV